MLYDGFINNQTEYDAKGLFDFIEAVQDRETKGGEKGWKSKLGELITPSDNFTPALNKVKNLTDVPSDWSNKIQRTFGKTGKVATGARRHERKHTITGKKRGALVAGEGREEGKDVRQIRRRGSIAGTQEEYDTATVHPQAPNKIRRMNISTFKKLVEYLHDSTVTNNTLLAPFKGVSINFLHDMIGGMAGGVPLNSAMKKVDMGRKGISATHRESSLRHVFALYYVYKEIADAPKTFSIGPHSLEPKDAIIPETKIQDNKDNIKKAIAWVKYQIKNKKSPAVLRAWRTFVEKSPITSETTKEVMQKIKTLKINQQKIPEDLQQEYNEIIDDARL
jgi:hypothetical protein